MASLADKQIPEPEGLGFKSLTQGQVATVAATLAHEPDQTKWPDLKQWGPNSLNTLRLYSSTMRMNDFADVRATNPAQAGAFLASSTATATKIGLAVNGLVAEDYKRLNPEQLAAIGTFKPDPLNTVVPRVPTTASVVPPLQPAAREAFQAAALKPGQPVAAPAVIKPLADPAALATKMAHSPQDQWAPGLQTMDPTAVGKLAEQSRVLLTRELSQARTEAVLLVRHNPSGALDKIENPAMRETVRDGLDKGQDINTIVGRLAKDQAAALNPINTVTSAILNKAEAASRPHAASAPAAAAPGTMPDYHQAPLPAVIQEKNPLTGFDAKVSGQQVVDAAKALADGKKPDISKFGVDATQAVLDQLRADFKGKPLDQKWVDAVTPVQQQGDRVQRAAQQQIEQLHSSGTGPASAQGLNPVEKKPADGFGSPAMPTPRDVWIRMTEKEQSQYEAQKTTLLTNIKAEASTDKNFAAKSAFLDKYDVKIRPSGIASGNEGGQTVRVAADQASPVDAALGRLKKELSTTPNAEMNDQKTQMLKELKAILPDQPTAALDSHGGTFALGGNIQTATQLTPTYNASAQGIASPQPGIAPTAAPAAPARKPLAAGATA